jgi:hypothetical protein
MRALANVSLKTKVVDLHDTDVVVATAAKRAKVRDVQFAWAIVDEALPDALGHAAAGRRTLPPTDDHRHHTVFPGAACMCSAAVGGSSLVVWASW